MIFTYLQIFHGFFFSSLRILKKLLNLKNCNPNSHTLFFRKREGGREGRHKQLNSFSLAGSHFFLKPLKLMREKSKEEKKN